MQKRPSQTRYLTKSRYITGLSCRKALWLMFNAPEKLPVVDEATQHRFDEGHLVGELAKSLFQRGIDIKEVIPDENDKVSRSLLKKRKPLFEAGFIHKNGRCYARADILYPTSNNQWDIIEVKSATGVKEEYLHDISFQKYCYESAGVKIRKCFVLHINNQYVRNGKIDPTEFFGKAEVTEHVENLMPEVPSHIKDLLNIIALKKCPEFKNGEDYHDDPSGIHDDDKIWKENPDSDIFDLYRGGRKALELFNMGVFRIKDIPDHHELNDKQTIQRETHTSGKPHIEDKELVSFIKSLEYPLYFIDFETYNTAIPLYNGLKPYQQIPFQFSVHLVSKKNQKPTHYSFIAEGAVDPRPKFAKELKHAIGTSGSIVVYNQSFEQTIVKNLGAYLPEYEQWAESIVKRMVDLLIPFRNFAYYHPSQKGSASLKRVLPALTGKTYEDFEIANGSQASLSYLFITHGAYSGEKAGSEETKKVRADLEKYCKQDTEGMIWILARLETLKERKI